MSINVKASRGAVVACSGVDAFDDLDVGRLHSYIVPRSDPVFWARLAVSKTPGRQLGDRVIGMRDAVIRASRSRGDEVCERGVTDPGAAIVVLQLTGQSFRS